MLIKVGERISELTNSVLEDTDFFLIDISIKGTNNPKISVFIDGSERNVTLDECAEISNELSFLIDAHEILSGSYRLNVSSPGLSRPLVDRRQYHKNIGRKVQVLFKNDDGQSKLEGILKVVLNDKIIIERQDERLTLSFDDIEETKIVPSLK